MTASATGADEQRVELTGPVRDGATDPRSGHLTEAEDERHDAIGGSEGSLLEIVRDIGGDEDREPEGGHAEGHYADGGPRLRVGEDQRRAEGHDHERAEHHCSSSEVVRQPAERGGTEDRCDAHDREQVRRVLRAEARVLLQRSAEELAIGRRVATEHHIGEGDERPARDTTERTEIGARRCRLGGWWS